jgi:hypothetical protein
MRPVPCDSSSPPLAPIHPSPQSTLSPFHHHPHHHPSPALRLENAGPRRIRPPAKRSITPPLSQQAIHTSHFPPPSGHVRLSVQAAAGSGLLGGITAPSRARSAPASTPPNKPGIARLRTRATQHASPPPHQPAEGLGLRKPAAAFRSQPAGPAPSKLSTPPHPPRTARLRTRPSPPLRTSHSHFSLLTSHFPPPPPRQHPANPNGIASPSPRLA